MFPVIPLIQEHVHGIRGVSLIQVYLLSTVLVLVLVTPSDA